jgi:hypothetical protein
MRRIRYPLGYQILHAGRILHANLRQHAAQTEQKVQNARFVAPYGLTT